MLGKTMYKRICSGRCACVSKALTDAGRRCRLMIMVRFFDTVAERAGIDRLEVDYATELACRIWLSGS